MIYITGDTHGDLTRFSSHAFPEQTNMTKDDYVIICGDFGGVWTRDQESKDESGWLDYLDSKPFTLLFVSGNHENFDRLLQYPEKEWNGGLVNEIRPSIFHLRRGQIFTLQGKKFFTFGGARSHDIDGGILELTDPLCRHKQRFAYLEGKHCRINHLSWWKEEEPTQEEMELGLRNLESANWSVDFVITHDCPTSVLIQYYGSSDSAEPYELTSYLEDIKQKLDYKKWFFGHHHDNKAITDKDLMLYEQIVQIV